MKLLKAKLIFLILFAAVSNAYAQQPSAPITWRVSVKMTSGSEGVAIIKAILSSGWHLYGTSLPNGGPKPTAISFEGSTGIDFTSVLTVSRAPLKVHDKMFDLELSWWDSDVTFRRKFKVTDPDNAKIAGHISYMGCNDVTCAPPATEKFSKPVKIRK